MGDVELFMVKAVLPASYVVVVAAVAVLVLSLLLSLVISFRRALVVLGGAVVLLVLLGVFYWLEGGGAQLGEQGISETASRLIGAALWLTYLLGGVAFLGLVVSEVLRWMR